MIALIQSAVVLLEAILVKKVKIFREVKVLALVTRHLIRVVAIMNKQNYYNVVMYGISSMDIGKIIGVSVNEKAKLQLGSHPLVTHFHYMQDG